MRSWTGEALDLVIGAQLVQPTAGVDSYALFGRPLE